MEIGADAVMINTAVAIAKDTVAMAKAFSMAVDAGRIAYFNARSQRSFKASPTSPLTAFLD
jgi:thiazole synthase